MTEKQKLLIKEAIRIIEDEVLNSIESGINDNDSDHLNNAVTNLEEALRDEAN